MNSSDLAANMHLRRARTSEAGLLTEIALEAKAHWKYPNEWLQLWAPALTVQPEQIDEHAFFVATINDAIVGFCAVFRGEHGVDLEHMWTKPAFMGRGIGCAMFEHACLWMQEQGIENFQIVADPGALGFYQKMGAVVIGEVASTPAPRTLPLLEFRLKLPSH